MLHILATIVLIGCLAPQHVQCRQKDDVISGIRIIDGLCLPKRTDRLVYRHKNDSSVYIAFDILKKGVVDVFAWDIVKHQTGSFISYKVKRQTVLAIDFRKQVNRDHVVGATNKRRQKNFKHRVDRKMKNCLKLIKKKRKNCKLTAIQSLLVRLEMRKVTFESFDNGAPSCQN